MNILVSGIGGPTPRSIAKTLKNGNKSVRVIGVDSNPKALGFYMRGLVDDALLVPKASDKDYWTAIMDLIATKKIDIAFIQPEVEVIAWGEYYKKNKAYPCPVFIPYVEMATKLIDKAEMAEILRGTHFIPKTIKITQGDTKLDQIEREIGYPCWIRATQGSGGLGSLMLKDRSSFLSWLFINSDIEEFTVSEYLTGRHLATQMLYTDGVLVSAAALECAEYVMASIAPSKVTGNTSFGRFLNDDRTLQFCDDCVRLVEQKTGVRAHGVLSFDLKEDHNGELKVTEVNIRHMAYTGVMAQVGFNLVEDTLLYLGGKLRETDRKKFYRYSQDDYIFLRDVDTEPVVLRESQLKIK